MEQVNGARTFWVLHLKPTAQWLTLQRAVPTGCWRNLLIGAQARPVWGPLGRACGKQQVLSGGHPGWG